MGRARRGRLLKFRALTWNGEPVNITAYMLETIEKLLILQDRDQQIARTKAELAQLDESARRLLANADTPNWGTV